MQLEDLKAKLIEFGIPAESIETYKDLRLDISSEHNEDGSHCVFSICRERDNTLTFSCIVTDNDESEAFALHYGTPFTLNRFCALHYGLTGMFNKNHD